MASSDSTTTAERLRQGAREATAAPKMIKAYQAGETVAGKYQLIELLGEGGMGAVWRAHNVTLDIDVAVKVIRRDEEDSDGPLLGDRLLQEARAAARLGHPSIARVFDFGVSELGDSFIVMELLEGEDLAQALTRRGRLSATKAVATLLPIAHALDAAHQKGIVHRDLKPENVFLARAEHGRVVPKLVDFGIAKIERTKNKRLTQTGTMLGSPLYMSPEQARGDDVNHLADVWALCVVLYELVTGRTPFEGKNYNALLYAIIADEPVPLTDLGFGDDALWGILQRGFQKDPAERWQSMRELGGALARWSIERDQHEDITGASLNAQWLRTLATSGDMLASMVPPPSETSTSLDVRDRTTEVENRTDGVRHATLEGGVVSLPTRARKRRLVAIALVSAALGAVGAVSLLVKNQSSAEAPDRASAGAALPDDTAATPQAEESGQLAVTAVGTATDVAVVATEQPPSAEPTPTAAATGSSVALTGTDATPAEASAAPSDSAPAKRNPRSARPAKKTKLKNPFD